MGSEQSSQGGSRRQQPAGRLTRGHTIATPISKDGQVLSSDVPPSGNTSPGASVCSDSDLPYISYTLNRPIGDSPKLSARGRGSASAGPSRRAIPTRRANSCAHTIVVVKEARPAQSSDRDEDLLRLQQIPMFLPIMRGTLGLPGARDPEILEGVDCGPWMRLCGRYQAHLAACAHLVSSEQNIITARCREVDGEVSRLLGGLVERQRRGARLAERLAQVRPLRQQLTRCHATLNRALQHLQDISLLLPANELEPFAWTTG